MTPFRPKPWLKIVLALGSLYACQPATQIENLRHGIPKSIVPGSYKLTVAAEAHDEESLKSLNTQTESIARDLGCGFGGMEALVWEPAAISADLASSYQLKLTDCEQTEDQVIETLQKLQAVPNVKEVEAEASIQLAWTDNDPLKARQYHHANIRRDEACDRLGGKPGQPVIVAVVDSGVDGQHPDLKTQLLRDANGQVIGANFVGKGANGSPDSNWADQNSHGTHVAGLVGSAGNNGAGGVGVASCANVKIMPVRVMNAQGQGSSIEIDRGVQWAAARGADIINLSLGGNNFFAQPKAIHPSALYSDLASKGVIVFAAAGNDGMKLGSNASGRGYAYSYPASYENVISVAATNARDEITGFSNRGATVDIAAPGDQDVSTVPGGGYQAMSGTSMASPVAAGAYALALSASRLSGKDRLLHKEVMPLLMQAIRSNRYSKSDVISGGLLDTALLTDLMLKGRAPTPEIPTPAPTPTPTEPRPEQPAPSQPAPAQPAPATMSFIGLKSGQIVWNASSFALAGWPQGKTARIYLYWVTSGDPTPYSFATLDRSDLDATGKFVKTPDFFYLYGRGTLVAEAVDTAGKQLETIKLNLIGR